MMLAKAVFDNKGETEEELSFKRGDVINVIQVDTNGLEGWWLCSLNGIVGIAPGNRLKQMTGMKDDVPGKVTSEESILNDKNINRKSYVQDSTKVVTPKRLGNVFLYNTEGTKLPMEDYDIPVPGINPLHNKMGGRKLQYDMYDSPKGKEVNIKVIEDIYDSPANRYKMLNVAMEHLRVQDSPPGSNRSSGISVLSGISGTSNHSTHSDSAPVSGRSSFDVTHDIYDIPPAARHLMTKSKSTDNVLFTNKSSQQDKKLRHVQSEIKPVPHPTETWGGDYCEIHEDDENSNPCMSPDSGVGFSKASVHLYEDPNLHRENVIDDLPMYDSPKNALAKADEVLRAYGRVQGYQTSGTVEKGQVYDVPPQVTKDCPMLFNTTISNNSSHRLSAGSNDSKGSSSTTDITEVSFDELALEMNAAIELLVSLQQDLHKAISRLLNFVSRTWRKRDNLEPKLFDVKISCLAIRTALQEYVEFGQGALANSVKLGDKKVFRKLKEYLQPLQEASEQVITSKKSLDGIKWDINKISTDLVDSTIIDDDLNKIVYVCRNSKEDVIKLSSFIQSNAPLLFQKYDFTPQPFFGANPGLTSGMASEHDNIRHKPPPPVKPKPKPTGTSIKPSENNNEQKLQHFPERPLPVPPLRRKDVRSTPLSKAIPPLPKHSTPERDFSGSDGRPQQVVSQDQGCNIPTSPITVYGAGEDYDIPKTQQEMEDIRQLQKKFSSLTTDNNNSSFDDTNKDYDNAATKFNYNQLEGYEDYENDTAEQDYDYVALTPDQVKNSLAFRYFEEGSISKVLTKPSDMYDSPSSHGKYPNSYQMDQSGNDTSVNNSSGQIYDFPNAISLDVYDSPHNNSSILNRSKNNFHGTSLDLDMSGQMDGMQVPSVRTSGLSAKFKEKMERLQVEAETNVVTHSEVGLQSNVNLQQVRKSQVPQMDKQILTFYYGQVDSHATVLLHAMEALFQAVDYNQPPKVFIAHSKFVILAAHKLVYIGDTISRNLMSEEVRNDIMVCANQLCDTLKYTVTTTKRAALAYPSISATQEMVDRVVDVNNAACGLKVVIAQHAGM